MRGLGNSNPAPPHDFSAFSPDLVDVEPGIGTQVDHDVGVAAPICGDRGGVNHHISPQSETTYLRPCMQRPQAV